IRVLPVNKSLVGIPIKVIIYCSTIQAEYLFAASCWIIGILLISKFPPLTITPQCLDLIESLWANNAASVEAPAPSINVLLRSNIYNIAPAFFFSVTLSLYSIYDLMISVFISLGVFIY